ncbi:MAG TPA: dihydrofolate reductase family protein [Solirubrobacterales bacterium]|nr:dihydrofolate reductase family protein [Solirubrobacterales bacterium]HMU26142.1 dihydrofolate reductase family protein [Solirubrobacterales bacterium]HMW44459.1 dihydrofolate reductase family protein [Solirubrobacterales bacterium]HMX71877.1 dihydrofolate reductase family protein [Solirubrobacterales bacterium]HMY25942.1 dihydrofolate reductase family protein [Solirubrobacterales bacterium]
MGRLIYGSMSITLDGYFADADGGIGWTVPEDEVHRLANQQVRGHAAVIMGRGLYEMMVPYWYDLLGSGEGGEIEQEFAMVWDEIPKFVASRTLTAVHETCQLIEGDAVDWIARKKAETDGDIEVSGIDLASQVEAAGLIDVYRFNLLPVVLGGGKPFFPGNGTRRDLELTDLQRFPGGTVALEYTVKR